MAARKKVSNNFTFAVGRRRTSVARVRLSRGSEQHIVNNIVIGEYFPGDEQKRLWNRPFQITQTEGKYHVTARIEGGGKRGQLGAFVHGVARALVALDSENYKPLLRKCGLLTRDPRARQRRMVGMGGKSRRKKQSPKR
ncbi:MAG: 30S ribosomal protein S9 [Candidatus Blackburnbacteria bacterium]|nr:30S ribosomal protein S9 [Candidatus Blackburnbacteria bacterium]